jgi:urease accessory protein
VSWLGRVELRYRRDGERCVGRDRHDGPLRVLKALYPEGPAVCHHVIVHPPGGIVGGDRLEVDVELEPGTQALITTPGATRFYRSAGPEASQQVALRLADGARLEWLPMESIAYRGCRALNALRLDLAPSAQCLGWDLLALGLPAAEQAFDAGSFAQSIELTGAWLERGVIDAADRRLLASPLGLGGHGVLATAWFAAGQAWPTAQREALLEAARDAVPAQTFASPAGVSAAHPQVVVLRALAPRVEPAFALLAAVSAAWRRVAWQQAAPPLRLWRT